MRVANYAQWRSREHNEAMLRDPEATPRMLAVTELAELDAHFYDVIAVEEAA